ncbi:MAG: DUF1674 domain-containing protein [Sphingomonadales bacterium]|nr:DUF1674 domain-containing protein [Sphingomonadales bacterium]
MPEKNALKRATQRPPHLDLPYPLSKSPPVPQPEEAKKKNSEEEKDMRTRYGDWEREGIAWDF